MGGCEGELNFLKETIQEFTSEGYQDSDIVFIGSLSVPSECTWSEFVTLANIEYDSGYGSNEIRDDIIIVFSDGAKMVRREYDGSEWWELQKPFKRPESLKSLNFVIGNGYRKPEGGV